MPSLHSVVLLLLLVLIESSESIPACVIIDTNLLPSSSNEGSSNRSSSSILLRNLRMLDQQRSGVLPEFLVDPVPLSYIDMKSLSSPSTPLAMKKSLGESSNVDPNFSPCSLTMLTDIESQMVVPFEFRRLRLEQADHHHKYLDDDPRDAVPDLSTAVYERRSDPDGLRFCRTCRDGLWTQLTVCEAVRCDAEALRANPRLVTEWGEIKPIEGGALYAPSTVFAIYAFAFGPHCKQCEPNGQWSRYALPELCSGIKFFTHPTTTISSSTKSKTTKIKSSKKP